MLTSAFVRPCAYIFIIFASALPARAALPTRTVALSARPAPEVGADFDQITYVALDAFGRTAFSSLISGSGIDDSNKYAIWTENDNGPVLVARAAGQAPGTNPGVAFKYFDNPLYAQTGHVAFVGFLTGNGVDPNDHGLWATDGNNLTLRARKGSTAPGTPPTGVFDLLNLQGRTLLNASGRVAFVATFTGTGVAGVGVWSDAYGPLAAVAVSGTQALGMPPGAKFSDIDTLAFSGTGRTAFRAKLTGGGLNDTNNLAIFLEGDNGPQPVAQTGSHAPDTAAGVVFSNFNDYPVINDASQMAFTASLAGPGVDPSVNGNGLWSNAGGPLALVVRAGDHAPGTPADVNFAAFQYPVTNSFGKAAFLGTLTGPDVVKFVNQQGIWAQRDGALVLIARAGDHAPGTPAGVNFLFSDTRPVINGNGRVAFAAKLTGSGVTPDVNDSGIWAETDAGLTLFARTGDKMDVALFDQRTISSLGFVDDTGLQEGRPSGFNDAGQAAFAAGFTDGSSGAFVTIKGAGGPACGFCGAGAPFAFALAGPLLVAVKKTRRRRTRR